MGRAMTLNQREEASEGDQQRSHAGVNEEQEVPPAHGTAGASDLRPLSVDEIVASLGESLEPDDEALLRAACVEDSASLSTEINRQVQKLTHGD